MNELGILYPVLAQIMLVFLLLTALGYRKSKVLGKKQVRLKETGLDNRAWPPSVVKVSNSIANQFETPILFYILCLILVLTQTAGAFSLFLAWTFVALRYLHAFIHITTNFVPYRATVFVVSVGILFVLFFKTVIGL